MMVPTVNGSTKLVGILGDPVAHSLSPAIHNHAFAQMNLPFIYLPLRVSKDHLHTAITALRALGFAGANVTIPHKQSVLSYCDILSDLSSVTGTVNTLYFRNGLLHGTTTDSDGFFRALASMEKNIESGRVVILGNGGIARTLGFAFAMDVKPESLTFIGRDIDRVKRLAEEIELKSGYSISQATFSDPDATQYFKNCSLLINCTSVGMHPDINRSPLPVDVFHKGMAVFDTVYNPAETAFLRHAKKSGCITQNGLKMLLYQGLSSFKYWTEMEAQEHLFNLGELQNLVTC